MVNPCRGFFEKNRNSSGKVKRLPNVDEAVRWESFSASVYSPGVLQADERYWRAVLSPIHSDT